MKPKIPWTKSMLEKFIEEALLTEDEEKIIRTRIAGWSIVKQSMEFGMSTASISRIIKGIRTKYMALQPQFPEIFPTIKKSKYEEAIDVLTTIQDIHCNMIVGESTTFCGKDLHTLTAEEIIKCQKNCPYNHFYEQ